MAEIYGRLPEISLDPDAADLRVGEALPEHVVIGAHRTNLVHQLLRERQRGAASMRVLGNRPCRAGSPERVGQEQIAPGKSSTDARRLAEGGV